MSKNTAYFGTAFREVMDYFYKNNVPVNLVYNDGSEQVVKIISYDNYNLICKEMEGKKSFNVFKHSLKRIETEINLEGVIDKATN